MGFQCCKKRVTERGRGGEKKREGQTYSNTERDRVRETQRGADVMMTRKNKRIKVVTTKYLLAKHLLQDMQEKLEKSEAREKPA